MSETGSIGSRTRSIKSNGDISNDLDGPVTQFLMSRHLYEVEYHKTVRLADNVTIAH